MTYHNKTTLFDRSSGEYRTVYYFLNKADGYYQIVDVFWEREIYIMRCTNKKPTYGCCVNMERLASVNRDLLLSMPYDMREHFNLDPFEPVLNFLNAIGFEKLDQNEYSSGVLHNKPWKKDVSRI